MNQLRDTAYKMRYVPADPKTFGTLPTFVQERSFKCSYRSMAAAENVRAGRDAGNTGLRIFYFPRYVSFSIADQIKIGDVLYDIIYIPAGSMYKNIDYIDTKAQQ